MPITTLPIKTNFDPVTHGFKFSNSDIEYELFGVVGKNLCGGMVYAAKDNFFHGRTIPSTTTPPARNTPLNSYIYDRQESAHWGTIPRFLTGVSWFVDSVAREYDKISKEVRISVPMPLFLIKDGTMKGHHVLVIGCKNSSSEPIPGPILDVYDPNYPNETTSINVDYNAKRFQLIGPDGSDRGYLKGFFVDGGYNPKKPFW